MPAKIEILSVDLLDKHHPLVNDLRSLANSLGLEFGWHYLLDLVWIISQLSLDKPSLHILDAGAGVGVMQWYLAERGAHVISVDRIDRVNLSLRFRGRYQVRGLRPQDLDSIPKKIFRGITSRETPLKNVLSDLAYSTVGIFHQGVSIIRGSVTIYHQDLLTLTDIPGNALDAVVSVSALEHNSPEDLVLVVAELMRVLKPGGKLLATLGAGNRDWFHQLSKGWCYTAESLRRLFDLPQDTPDNYARYGELLAALCNCAELRDNLAGFYFCSGDNGMPWGKWDPQYQPVGVCKVKE
jgi:SAM-dependent methyltransferase